MDVDRRSSSNNLAKIESFRRKFVDKANTFLWHIYKKEDTFAWIDVSIDTPYTCYCESLKFETAA